MTSSPEPHRPLGRTSLDAARRLLDGELSGESPVDMADAGALAAAGERLVLRLTDGLSRSFGAFGAVALLQRALTRVQAGHPVLAAVSITATTAASLSDAARRPYGFSGFSAGASARGAPAALDGLTAWLAELADLMSELIGDELAHTLLSQSADPRQPGTAAPGSPGAETAANEPGRADDVGHTHPRTVADL